MDVNVFLIFIYSNCDFAFYLKFSFQENMIITYSPQSPDRYNQYTRPLKSLTLSRGIVREQSLFNPLVHQPLSKPATLRATISHVHHLNMKTALEDIGGVGTILFLFAKVKDHLLFFISIMYILVYH